MSHFETRDITQELKWQNYAFYIIAAIDGILIALGKSLSDI